MASIDAVVEKEQSPKCQQCTDSNLCTECSDRDLRTQLREALGKIDSLTGQIGSLENRLGRQSDIVRTQNDRLLQLESGCSASSGTDSKGSNGRKKKSKVGDAAKANKKLVRIEEEKERQFRVMTENITLVDESSEEELTMRGIRRKMTKKQREGCNQSVTGRLQQAGATYPLEDLDTTYSSGTDFSDVDRES